MTWFDVFFAVLIFAFGFFAGMYAVAAWAAREVRVELARLRRANELEFEQRWRAFKQKENS